MPRAVTTKVYRSFVKGLITEASPLTYPPDASLDEDNCILYRKGNRTRRLGFDFEDDFEYNSLGAFTEHAIMEYRWETVSNVANLNFLVVQAGHKLHFYDMAAEPLSSGLKSFSVDLSDFTAPNASDPENCQVAMVGGKGLLFVSGSQFEPFYVEYKQDQDTILTKKIYVLIRDFKGVDDSLANSEEPTFLTNLHHYNLRNQGWLDPGSGSGSIGTVYYYNQFGELASYAGPPSTPITTYYNQFKRYPPNSKQWWVGKNQNNQNFNPEFISKYFTGNNRAPRGHFVLNAFYKDRSAMSGVAGIPVESVDERPPTISFFSGRVWYGLNGDVFYSQVCDDKSKAGFCYQEADPTNEDMSDLIATDGGVVPIPECGKVVRLFPAGSGMMVFATNGIWYISGTTAGFSATDISVSKISPIGCESPNSIVEAEGQIFWWSKVGIMGMNPKTGIFGPIDGSFEKLNISETTIQTFYNENIPEDAKPYVKAVFDASSNTIQWLFRDNTLTGNYRYNRVLNFDVTLGAFYPWTVTSTPNAHIIGIFTTPRLNAVYNETDVVNSVFQTVTNSSASDVVIDLLNTEARQTFIKYLVIAGTEYTFGTFNNDNYCDWETYLGTGLSYMSFIETGEELLEDTMRKKQTPYVFTYFQRTEENFVDPDADDIYTVDKPSSCYMQIKWDWADTATSGKWSTKFQAYRHRRVPVLNPNDPIFDTGFSVVMSKHKIRGWGRAMRFRFECDEIGKNFNLLGWAAEVSGTTKV